VALETIINRNSYLSKKKRKRKRRGSRGEWKKKKVTKNSQSGNKRKRQFTRKKGKAGGTNKLCGCLSIVDRPRILIMHGQGILAWRKQRFKGRGATKKIEGRGPLTVRAKCQRCKTSRQ